jgi:NADP-dependent 3-hydroxy acid dehydrogenase YdfG
MVGKVESGKDTVQQLVESAAIHVGRITVIITGAVAGVAREIGDWMSEGFEMVEASRRAQIDQDTRQLPGGDRELFIEDKPS